ncbi:MAG: hypothetical protein R3F56_26395 [Planctomycetota bacterium]
MHSAKIDQRFRRLGIFTRLLEQADLHLGDAVEPLAMTNPFNKRVRRCGCG